MIIHYFKIALRSLRKQQTAAIINFFGLSLGIACVILLILYAVNELGFDRFHINGSNIFRVYEQRKPAGGKEEFTLSTAMPLGPTLKKDIPDVLEYVRLKEPNSETVIRFGQELRSVPVSFADPQFFSMFSFKFKRGNGKIVLDAVNNIVLTTKTANEFFGSVEIIGKVIELKIENQFHPFVISGVLEDIPANSSIRFRIIASFGWLEKTRFGERFNNWYTTSFRTFIQLSPDSRLSANPNSLDKFYKLYNPPDDNRSEKEKPVNTYRLQPLRSMHTGLVPDDPSAVDPRNSWIIISIAVAVLFLACVNFTTLSLARSLSRSVEVGVRKVAGAGRGQLICQFLSEALLFSFAAMLSGILIALIALPYFNGLSGSALRFSLVLYPEFSWLLPLLLIIVSFLAGGYPAFVLSAFRPAEVLKNKIRTGSSGFLIKALVVLQFTVSTGLITATVFIMQQAGYLSGKNPGFRKENIIMVDAAGTDMKRNYPLLRQLLSDKAGIAGVSAAETGLGEGADFMLHGFKFYGTRKSVYEYLIDPDYITQLDMRLVAGRNFDREIAGDTLYNVIINETAAASFGWSSQEAIGRQINGYTNSSSPFVVGVVKDFNFQPLTSKIQPQLFHQFAGHSPGKIFIRLQPGNPTSSLVFIGQCWKKLLPDTPFRFNFLDETVDQLYKSERRWSSIIGWSGGIAIFLACLGLFGLASLSVTKRRKEMGVRKVFGASVREIVSLVAGEFLMLIVLSLLLACPVVWYLMNAWLQDYAYRIRIEPWVFGIVGVAVLTLAAGTVSFHALKIAYSKPSASLRVD